MFFVCKSRGPVLQFNAEPTLIENRTTSKIVNSISNASEQSDTKLSLYDANSALMDVDCRGAAMYYQ
jgi:hypothetical protein